MIKVKVGYPVVHHDTVSFAWHSDKDIPFLKQESFYVKYEGMNIENLKREVLWQVFLSTMVPVFNLCEEKVELIFPSCIPMSLAETWINYNTALNVDISPLSKITNINIDTPNDEQGKTKVGLLFGGGKDSTCAFSMLSEIYGIENTVLISYAAPITGSPRALKDQRRERLLLDPLRKELNVKIQKVITNIRAIMVDRVTSKHIHIALFVGPALPIILHYNLNILTFSLEFNTFFTSYHNTGERKFYYMRSRPEFCSYISERTNKLFGTDFILIDPNFSFSILVAIKILANRYPHMLKHLLMCESTDNPNEKWCYNCTKCATMALYCLCYLKGETFIDVSRVLTENKYIKKALKEGKLLNALSNMVADIDPEYVKEKVPEEAYKNFMALREKFSHEKNPCFDSFLLPAFEKQNLPKPLSEKLKNIITQYCPTLTEMQPFIFAGTKLVESDFSLKCEVADVFNKSL